MSTAYPVQPVSLAGSVFTRNVDDLLPPWIEIPEEFRRHLSPWCGLVDAWFFDGLASIDSPPKTGIDLRGAIRHLDAIMRSYCPKHEHKIAGVAFLMSLWFEGPPRWTSQKGGRA